MFLRPFVGKIYFLGGFSGGLVPDLSPDLPSSLFSVLGFKFFSDLSLSERLFFCLLSGGKFKSFLLELSLLESVRFW